MDEYDPSNIWNKNKTEIYQCVEVLTHEFKPASPYQETLIRNMAQAQWRIDLVGRMELIAVEVICAGFNNLTTPEHNLVLTLMANKRTPLLSQIRIMRESAERTYFRWAREYRRSQIVEPNPKKGPKPKNPEFPPEIDPQPLPGFSTPTLSLRL